MSYELGQHVKIVDNTCFHGFGIGDIIEIVYEHGDGWYEAIKLGDDTLDTWNVSDDDIEVIE